MHNQNTISIIGSSSVNTEPTPIGKTPLSPGGQRQSLQQQENQPGPTAFAPVPEDDGEENIMFLGKNPGGMGAAAKR